MQRGTENTVFKVFFISFLIFSEFWNGILSSMVFSILSTYVNYKNNKWKLKCTFSARQDPPPSSTVAEGKLRRGKFVHISVFIKQAMKT